MNYTKIKRLNEDHESALPAELLSMTVGEMLDKLGEIDTADSAEYEIIEDALAALKDRLVSDGYENDTAIDTDNTVEVDNVDNDVDFNSEDEDEFPTFDQTERSAPGQNDDNSLDYNF